MVFHRSPPDSAEAEAVKVVARMHKTLIWERVPVPRSGWGTRRASASQAALAVFEDLDAADTLELLGRAPDPGSGLWVAVSGTLAGVGRWVRLAAQRGAKFDVRRRVPCATWEQA